MDACELVWPGGRGLKLTLGHPLILGREHASPSGGAVHISRAQCEVALLQGQDQAWRVRVRSLAKLNPTLIQREGQSTAQVLATDQTVELIAGDRIILLGCLPEDYITLMPPMPVDSPDAKRPRLMTAPDAELALLSPSAIRPVVLVMVGAPGSGKSTFCQQLMLDAKSPWCRICQDVIKKSHRNKPREACVTLARKALLEGTSCLIDRCNFDAPQRQDFLALASEFGLQAHCVVLQLPHRLCVSRAAARVGHEGGVTPEQAQAVVGRMTAQMRPPSTSEGIASIMTCTTDRAVEAARKAWHLYEGDAAAVLRAWEASKPKTTTLTSLWGSTSSAQTRQESCKPATAAATKGAAPRQPYPPQQASARPESQQQQQETAVQSCHPLQCLPIASQQNKSRPGQEGNAVAGVINTDNDHSQLHPFEAIDAHNSTAASAAVDIPCKQRQQQQQPLPSLAPAASLQETTAAVHQHVPAPAEVNPNVSLPPPNDSSMLDESPVQDPDNCSNVLPPCSRDPQAAPAATEAGSSWHPERLASANEVKQAQSAAGGRKTSTAPSDPGGLSTKPETNGPQAATHGKKNAFSMLLSSSGRKSAAGPAKAAGIPKGHQAPGSWQSSGSWDDKLIKVAQNPDACRDIYAEVRADEQCVLIPDMFPKSQYHALIIARDACLVGPDDLRPEHLPLLKHMQAVASAWIGQQPKTATAASSFRLGFHHVPSMRQLHMHVISQDFTALHLKTKRHYNSFTTSFFLDLSDVLQQLESNGCLQLHKSAAEALLKGDLRCHHPGCSVTPKTMPQLKQHLAQHEEGRA
ncbi:hypothetical protein WJX74_000595 [Apatococcus lobatus]|uniref:Aprataxin C2HE/C2H2/C2HC zinc finger domain-containing protein n=1 Tax=Apatococcus lobatus TaxID=904363 RepID=A0AAW1S1Q2_9CHLO